MVHHGLHINFCKSGLSFEYSRCNDKSSVFIQPVYNCEPVHMCIVVLTNKVIYVTVVGLRHMHAGCVYKL